MKGLNMEKIESIEQLDALGIKICEMLQVGIDKANTVVPETLQQMVAWEIWGNAIASIFLAIVIAALIRIIVPLCKRFILDVSNDDAAFILRGAVITVCSVSILVSLIHLLRESLPSLIKALVAPNLVIIEQLGGLVK